MEKKEFKKMFKEYVKKMGFLAQGNCFYKILNNDYAITLYLDHHPYTAAYYIEYGVIYEFDSTLKVSHQICWDSRFLFTKIPTDDLNLYNIGIECTYNTNQLIDWFDYVNRSKENFEEQFSLNLHQCLSVLCDESYVLDLYRRNGYLFRGLPYKIQDKIVRLGNLDLKKITDIRNGIQFDDWDCSLTIEDQSD